MTVEELLKQRYVVENLYPGCDFQPFEILYANDKGTVDVYEDWSKWELHVKNYPYLFRKMGWWEEREEKDMPMYLKHDTENVGTYPTKGEEYLKVKSHWCRDMEWRSHTKTHFTIDKPLGQRPYSAYIPITEQEYNDYLKQPH